MKKWLLLIGSMTLATAGFCGVAQFDGETTCYVYKQDRLLKKVQCHYEGAEGAAMSYAFRDITYTLPSFGKMSTSNSADGFDAEGNVTGMTTTVNDEPAIIRSRALSNQKIVSDKYAQTHATLECYLSTKSHWEICANPE